MFVQMPLSKLQRLSLGRKAILLFSFPAIAQLIFVIGLGSVERHRVAEQRQQELVRQQRSAANRVLGLLYDLQLSARHYLVNSSGVAPEEFDAAATELPAVTAVVVSAGTPEARRFAAATGEVLRLQRATRAAIATGQVERARETSAREVIPAMQRFRLAHLEFVRERDARAVELESTVISSTRRIRRIVTAAAVLNLLLLVLIGSAFLRALLRRIGVVLENTRRLEHGQMMFTPLPPGDEISELDAAFHRMAEGLAKRTRELHATNGEIESFTYSVSHDLRAPLRAIGGYAEMLEEDCASLLNDEGRRFIGTIRTETARMGQLIDDLLRFSRVSRQPLSTGAVDVAAIVESCISELRAAHPGRRMEFRVGALPAAECDASLMRVVFMNLLSNAVKYTGQRAVAEITVSGVHEENECIYEVSDNGVGFDMRYADKIFAVFQRLHDATQFEGTGVGLAIVERIVQRHGGRVGAQSERGKGATFTITLPAAGEIHHAA